MKLKINRLELSWSISRGRDTYGYNICRLDDTTARRRFRCNGGGYDMVGTVFGEFLAETYQERLLALKDRAHRHVENIGGNYVNVHYDGPDKLYGMAYIKDDKGERISLDGACGINSMRTIAEAIGLEVSYTRSVRGKHSGFLVSETA